MPRQGEARAQPERHQLHGLVARAESVKLFVSAVKIVGDDTENPVIKSSAGRRNDQLVILAHVARVGAALEGKQCWIVAIAAECFPGALFQHGVDPMTFSGCVPAVADEKPRS